MFCSKCGANVAEGAAFCASCGMPVVGYSVGQAPTGGAAPPAQGSAPAAGTAGSYAPAAGSYAPGYAGARPTVTYAGFWLRFVAAIIDCLVRLVFLVPLWLLVIGSTFPTLMEMGRERNPFEVMPILLPRLLLFGLIWLVAKWLYFALLESSTWQATLGKKALGLSVTDLQGNRLTFGHATGRFFAGRGVWVFPYIGWLYYIISCICAGFTEKKQAIHDMIASCLVLRKV